MSPRMLTRSVVFCRPPKATLSPSPRRAFFRIAVLSTALSWRWKRKTGPWMPSKPRTMLGTRRMAGGRRPPGLQMINLSGQRFFNVIAMHHTHTHTTFPHAGTSGKMSSCVPRSTRSSGRRSWPLTPSTPAPRSPAPPKSSDIRCYSNIRR